LAIVAFFLSVRGLYSVLAFSVTQRADKIGIRMALGAERRQVIGLVLSQGMRVVMIDLLLGLGVAGASARALGSLLYDVQLVDPMVGAGVPILGVAVAIRACLLSSSLASRIEALVVLRSG
jgi:ABC-type antimicrobial peptide transport system permease subunit